MGEETRGSNGPTPGREDVADTIRRVRENGVTFQHRAGPYALYTQAAADSLIGQTTEMDAKEFGVDETWPMKIVGAKLLDEGEVIEITLTPVE